VPSERLVERRKAFKQYKEDVRERGKPFFPYAMFEDSVMSLVVVIIVISLAVIWKWTTPGDHTGLGLHGSTDTPDQAGWLGKLYDDPADPGTTSFVPRPDWYFYFLFYLLRIFKWPPTVVLGTVGIPTILLILLMAMPFLDTRAERRPSRRPVAMVAAILTIISMGVLTYKGATAKESLGSELVASVPKWAVQEGFAKNPKALAGAKLFAESGCASCHTYNGAGSSNQGAPDLTSIGKSNEGPAFFAQYVANPRKFGNNVMPQFGAKYGGALSDAQLAQLGAFLDASKGG
jgi:menaquinol-cytochrome c reductase cytochrome b/c subunit